MSAPPPTPAPDSANNPPAPVVLPRYTPLILAPRRRAAHNPTPLEPPTQYHTEYWVHWTYSEDEWMAWAEHELATARRAHEGFQALTRVVLAGVAVLALAAGTLVAVRSVNPSALLTVLMMAFGAIVLISVAGLADTYPEALARYRLRRDGPRESAIGPWWVWQAGQATPLLYYSHSRIYVRLTDQPPLQIKFRIEERSSLFARQDTVREISVLVPQGHEPEAEQLVARFRREVIYSPAAAHPPRQEPTPPPLLAPAPGHGPAITERLPPLPPLPADPDTQRLPPR